MRYEFDILKNEIKKNIRFAIALCTLAFNENDKAKKINIKEISDDDYKKYTNLIDDGKINEAENMLYEEINSGDNNKMLLALDVYDYINEKDDAFLIDNNYSREEINEGVNNVISALGGVRYEFDR